MNKTGLIARHEFLITVRRKAFIIFTLAFPLLAVLAILAAQLISSAGKPTVTETKTIGYVDMGGTFNQYTTQGEITLRKYASESIAREALLNKNIEEYIVIPQNYMSTGMVQRYTINRELDPDTKTVQALTSFLMSNLLKNNPPDIVARAKAPLNYSTTLLSEDGTPAPNQGSFASFIVPYIFSLLLLMSIFFSSGYLLQGLGEEKENRVMEILLSSVSSRALLAGKVIGLGAAGLLQIIIWLISAQFLAGYASSTWGNVIGSLNVSAEFMILGALYFILGYLLFAVLMAGVGAITPTAREGSQMSTVFSLSSVIPLFFMASIIQNPHSVGAVILTIIPFTAPITMMIRLGISQIPLWQILVSVAVMGVTIGGGFMLAAKLFRTYLLMYGKAPAMKQILRSFRNA